MNLKIDPEFESKIPPLTEDEFQQLEENIVADGEVIMPLIVWNGVIVDGHNRYKVICAHPEVKFSIHNMDFTDRYAALIWICRNQLGRRNLTPQQKKYVIGQRYEVEKQSESFHGNQHTLAEESGDDQFGHHQNGIKTRQRIAQESKTSEGYVERANHYAKGVDAAEKVLPGIKQELLSGSIRPTETEVAAVARATPEERPRLAQRLHMTKKEKQEEMEGQQTEAEYQQNTELSFPYENERADEGIETPPEEEKAGDAPDTKPLGKHRFSTKDILQISEGLLHSKTVTEDSILGCLNDTVNTMINSCSHYFTEYPRLLTEPEYKTQVLQTLQKCVKFVQDIEKGKAYET